MQACGLVAMQQRLRTTKVDEEARNAAVQRAATLLDKASTLTGIVTTIESDAKTRADVRDSVQPRLQPSCDATCRAAQQRVERMMQSLPAAQSSKEAGASTAAPRLLELVQLLQMETMTLLV